MKISILIKALNEEALIAKCLEAAVAEIKKVDGEVILVDSLSTDRTIQIAKQYPIRIVQFAHKVDCGCASAVQLGYQYAQGEYIYVLDGDMVLQPGFVLEALNYLESNPNTAGVAGKLIDTSIKTWADKRRATIAVSQQQIKEVTELDGGGIYRRSAIESVNYLAHRWLPACEEAELGARLRAKGWRLVRLPQIAVLHTGYSENTSQMLFRLWRSRRLHAYGMYLRSAFGKPWWKYSLYQIWFIFIAPAFHIAAIALSLCIVQVSTNTFLPVFLGTELLVWTAGIAILAIKKKSVTNALLSAYGWNFFSLAAAIGAAHPIPDPKIPIDAQEITNSNAPK